MITAQKTYDFSSDANACFSTTVDFGDFGLVDGSYTASYSLQDASGLTRLGTFTVALHNTPPCAPDSGSLLRCSPTAGGQSNAWSPASLTLPGQSSAQNAFVTSSSSVSGIANSATGLDGISFTYVDTAETSASFDLGRYTFKVTDGATSATTQMTSADTVSAPTSPGFYWTGSSLVYLFRWKSGQTSRTLGLEVTDEAGVSSGQTEITIVKPVWSSYISSEPEKVDASDHSSFGAVWTDNGTEYGGWTKGIRWDVASASGADYSSYAPTVDSQVGLTPAGDSIRVGQTLDYEPVITNTSGFAPIEVQGTQGRAYIGYEPLASPTLPSGVFFGAGAGSTLGVGDIATTALDGTAIQYALCISARTAAGTMTRYFPYSRAEGSFPYSLWELFGIARGSDLSASLQSLATAIGGVKKISVSIVAWYGDPLQAGAPQVGSAQAPDPDAGAFRANGTLLDDEPSSPIQLEQTWSLSGVGADVAPPVVNLTGALARPDIPTDTLLVSGAASDAGGSGLSSVQVMYAPMVLDPSLGWIVPAGVSYVAVPLSFDAQGNFSYDLASDKSLADNMYSVQVVGADAAGNQSTNSAVRKLLDTHAPVVKKFTLSSSLAGPSGSVQASMSVDDGQGSGKPGSGLMAVYYQWEDGQGKALSADGWVAAVLSPAVSPTFDGLHTIAESYTVGFDGAPSGTSYLHYKFVDKAGNSSGDLSVTQGVSYEGQAPAVALDVSGWASSGGQYWIKNSSDLTVGYSQAESSGANDVASARWNVQLVNVDGSFQDDSGTWGAWGASFTTVRSLIKTDGQAYRIQLQVQNANGVAGPAISSQVFTKDASGPKHVSANLGRTAVTSGQSIRPTVSGTDPYSPLTWTWTYQGVGGSAITQSYVPGSDIVLLYTGSGTATYTVTFTATSGSGLSASSSGIAVSVSGNGLVVDDNERYTDGTGTVSGRWSYVGAASAETAPAAYSYRWIRVSDGKLLQDWANGDATNSSALSLGGIGVSLAQGDVIQLEVQAFDSQGTRLDDERSAGATVDMTPPSASLAESPQFVSPNDVWLRFAAGDPDSGIKGATVLVKRLSVDAQGAGTWNVATQASLPASGGQRVDLDMSGAPWNLATGDRIVVEASIENGAGLTSTVETGVMLVDADPPPVPLVIPVATAGDGILVVIPAAVDQTQQEIGLDFSHSTPDAVSGTAQYLWKAYRGGTDPSTTPWTAVPAGQMKVTRLDYSTAADGTVLYFAVMTVNGAGLSSVGYSRGIVLDSKAPQIFDLSMEHPIGGGYAAIGAFVQQSDMRGGIVGVFNAVDQIAGLASFEIQAGAWSTDAGFAGAGTPLDFAADTPDEESQKSPLITSLAGAVGLYAAQGRAFNAAGNAAVYTSAAFQVVGSPPGIASLAGNLGPNALSFTWTVDASPLPADFAGYSITLATTKDGSSLLKDSAGNAVKTLSVSVPAYTLSDWASLGLAKGDSVVFTVTPQTQLGAGQPKSITVKLQPDQPVNTSLMYTRYFSTHFNLKQASYAVDSGIEQTQMRVLDGTTGQLIQDWTPDYSGANARWTMAYPAADGIVDGQRLILEVRAESACGVWSGVTPTQAIKVDETPATGVGISRGSAYSNAQRGAGAIDGWAVSAEDDQSGILAYQTALLTASAYSALVNGSGLAQVGWTSQAVPASAAPGQAWQATGATVGGATAQTDYYAVVRVQNGTEDWGPPVASPVVHVSWTPPTVSIAYDAAVVANRRDATGNVVTNASSETLTLRSTEASTTFQVSVNGLVVGTTSSGAVGSGGVSTGTIAISGPGTDALSVAGTDLYGNEGYANDSIRFNQAATIRIASALGTAKVYTTPGKPVALEQALGVSDDYRDYPIAYSFALGGGTLIASTGSASALSGASGAPASPWVPGGTTTAMYLQSSPKAQISTYTLTVTVTDTWGLATTQAIPIEVDNTTLGALYTSEYWTGSVLLQGIVEVPSGLSLTLDSVQGSAYGSPLDANAVMPGGITVDSGGRLVVSNAGAASKFDSSLPGYLWKGFRVLGSMSGSGLELDHAERGLTLLLGGSLGFSSLTLSNDLIGLHLLGGTVSLSGGTISGNAEYGIKEDGSGTFTVQNMTFSGNGVDYYENGVTGISIPELNALPGNGGNQ